MLKIMLKLEREDSIILYSIHYRLKPRFSNDKMMSQANSRGEIMNTDKKQLDTQLYKITRVMWFGLSCVSVYILYTVYNMTVEPESALGVYHTIPEMIENVLAGCVVVTAFSALFEYLSGQS